MYTEIKKAKNKLYKLADTVDTFNKTKVFNRKVKYPILWLLLGVLCLNIIGWVFMFLTGVIVYSLIAYALFSLFAFHRTEKKLDLAYGLKHSKERIIESRKESYFYKLFQKLKDR